MKKSVLLPLAFLCLLLPKHSTAVPAYPEPVDFKQPDGSHVNIKMFGDEHFNRVESLDGYTLSVNNKGFYEYAIKNQQGALVPSGIVAKNAVSRTAVDNSLLERTPKNLRLNPDQVNMLKQVEAIYATEQQRQAFPTTGNRKLLCILIGFTDRSFTKSKADFENLFNQIKYTTDGATGSVKDYYLENSWGKLNLDVTAAGPYIASNSMAYYGADSGASKFPRARDLINEAVNAADTDVNYADFDNDNDGVVDGVYVIFAGYGQEAGASTDTIWSHAWAIDPVELDGKIVYSYSCSPELRGNSGAGITRIGVICHEFGHVMGAPDFYDTDYETGGEYEGTGRWDLMAGGTWNNSGATPAHHNGFTKSYYYKWTSMIELVPDREVSMPKIETNEAVYSYASPTAGEYWVLENRQLSGFDSSLPGHGLLVYHVDENNIIKNEYDINSTHPQYMYPVCAGAAMNPSSDPASYGTINSGICSFPGTIGKTAFTYSTFPAAISWAGQRSNKAITGITEIDGSVTFDFNLSEPPLPKSNPAAAAIIKLLL
ncbi:MAG: M6 family metalloprotease domain-containing protein [Candidatus Electronema aureum]|uniref:M6 family metalloprotease domain-containing protein n=1 Tax=Candidatus Electronema aureum TaxID=2005002 RepID=A0A521FZ69_9BACT|nr:MAG: M6 family metalloprotease domain-containing protein [Candidatus Electronema aureum]